MKQALVVAVVVAGLGAMAPATARAGGLTWEADGAALYYRDRGGAALADDREVEQPTGALAIAVGWRVTSKLAVVVHVGASIEHYSQGYLGVPVSETYRFTQVPLDGAVGVAIARGLIAWVGRRAIISHDHETRCVYTCMAKPSTTTLLDGGTVLGMTFIAHLWHWGAVQAGPALQLEVTTRGYASGGIGFAIDH